MILKFYRSNSVITLFVLPFVILLLWLPSIFSEQVLTIHSNSFLFDWFVPKHPIMNRILAMLLVFVTSLQINRLANTNDIFEKNTFLPALLYTILMSSIADLHQMHPLLITNLFWATAFRKLLNIYNQVQCKAEVFDASFLITLGALFTFPSAGIVILLPWVTLMSIRPFNFREYMMPFISMLIIALYVATYYFVTKDEVYFFESLSAYQDFSITMNWIHYVLYGLLVCIMYLSGHYLIKKSNKGNLRFRRITTVLIFFLSLVLICMLYEKFVTNNDSFILFGAIPFSLLWTFYFYYAQKKWLSSLLFYPLFLLIMLNNYSQLIF